MAETLRVSERGIHLVAQAGRRKGWTKTRTPAWWDAAHTSQATLRRFWRRLPISRESFIAICQAVDISDWEGMVDSQPVHEIELPLDIQKGKRTLAAIVFTDAVNFSKRMDADEEHTLDLIDRDLYMMTETCKRFEGQVLKSTGDGLLMYFTSAIQAVGCALGIQKALAEFDANLSSEDVLQHRIGIHLGDVFVSEGDVMGNGVNIAARLQTVAAPGSICISQTVYDVVKHSLSLKVNYLGPQALKNISESVPVYQILHTSRKAREEIREGEVLTPHPKSPMKVREDWGEAPDVSHFYGRAEELQLLEHWIVRDSSKVIALFGMGGIGKTTLALTLADQIQDNFERLVWRSLKPMPPLSTFLRSLLKFFSQGTEIAVTDGDRESISQLIGYLRQQRCLIILDEAEAILGSSEGKSATGQCREGYEGYAELLKRLGNERHQSCILLTSREKPDAVAMLEGQNLPVRSLRLGGLQEADALQLFQAKGFSGSEKDLTDLIDLYGGSPLALKVITTIIQEVFGGNIRDFLSQNTVVLGDSLRQLLKEQVSRLSPLEKDVVYWLTIERKPISISELRANFLLMPTVGHLVEALASLERRSLIDKKTESSNATFTLQPMVMKYVAEEFIEQVIDEIDAAISDKTIQCFKFLRKFAVIKHELESTSTNNSSRWMLTRLKDSLQVELGFEVAEEICNLVPLLQGKPLPIIGYLSRNLLELLNAFEIETDSFKDIPLR